ncbi:SDR family NAD(P)-dependent oxidoreductase [Microbacterium sp. NPDC077663]|uniref:SDR family NAD(P)-dependent oxidoreductase n=1 Tax=Microbacterium sp. NPDC077663 TaxID=3364189 RepID=UPI0037CA929B
MAHEKIGQNAMTAADIAGAAGGPPHLGRVAVVTGGVSGIGAAAVKRLLIAGAEVVVVDANPAVEELRVGDDALDAHLSGIRVDLAHSDDVRRASSTILERFGRVDVLVNSAGINPKHTGGKYQAEDIPLEIWEAVLAVNLTAPFLLMAALLPQMKERGWGRVVNVASSAALGRPPVASAYYVASKAGVLGLTRCVAEEAAPHGVTVNSVLPGPTRTGLTALSSAETISELSKGIPVGRYAEPDEIASMIDYLCSDAAAFVTGATVAVDGGSVMGS